MEYEEDYYENAFEIDHCEDFEALRELEDEQNVPTVSKRRLNFDTTAENEDNNVLEQFSKEDSDVEYQLEDPVVDSQPVSKRARRESDSSTFYQNVDMPIISSPLLKVEKIVEKVTKLGELKKIDYSRESISVTGFNGKCTYFYYKPIKCTSYWQKTKPGVGNLLSVPYSVLRDQIEKERELKLLQINLLLPIDSTENEQNASSSNNNSNALVENNQLWVEKFKPKEFTELLSDDGINRTLLFWLKQWDFVVFGREKTVVNATKSKKPPDVVFFKESFAINKLKEMDDLKRPFFKIVLLCGPPGLGKTTLAFIIAKHAGYNVVEMNASDDRTQEKFQRQLESSTQMRSVMEGPNSKPNCLIIDEIDGAPAPAINLLVSYAKSVKNKKSSAVLLRPIVCICNDLYTPALRPLKQIAFVLNFPPTASARLATRLMDITRTEFIKTDRSVLLALCSKTENDIRSCLSTLQYLKDAKKELKIGDIENINIGQKDMRKSIFSIWQSIFQQQRKAKKKNRNFNTENNLQRIREEEENISSCAFQNILKLVQSHGEYDKIIQGVFANYLSINYKDPLLEMTVEGTDWLSHTDLLTQQISSSQNYTLLPYIPYSMVLFHLLFSVSSFSKLTYPSVQYEQKTRQNQLENIIESMYSFMCPTARSFLNISTVAMQLLPWLSIIIQPVLRPVNIQLYSQWEKSELKQAIEAMVAYNLVYRQERSVEGQYSFVLEPAIEEVIRFPGLKTDQGLSYATKSLIARELNVEKMRRNEGKFEVRESRAVTVKPTVKANTTPYTRKVFKPKEQELEAVDFFGRKLLNQKKVDTFENSNVLGTGLVWFHFKEGYSNAARHKVLISDLL